jgi:hypothetical protein
LQDVERFNAVVDVKIAALARFDFDNGGNDLHIGRTGQVSAFLFLSLWGVRQSLRRQPGRKSEAK